MYFINEEGSKLGRQYVQFLDVRNKGLLIGHIVLTVKLGDESPRNTYPELLVDNRFIQAPETRSYSYAIYNAGKQLVYSSGNYNYERKLPTSLLSDSLLYEKGTSYKNYKHVGVHRNNRTVVISSPDYLIRNIFANFSFSYLVLILYVLVLMLLYAFRYRVAQISINYATKTQIFLNVAFFLPLTLVVVITLGVISSNFATNQENAYINTTKNIVSNFLPYLKDYQQGKVSKEYMEEELRKIARDAELDINLFNPSGQLYSSTQPLIYETGYLSKYINPKAYIHLIEDKENQVVLNESLGSKEFQTVYVGIKSYDGQLLGVLGIPHFDSKSELERQLIEVISTALSVFIGLFLVFLLLSYWASTILTKPLKLITQKIRKTNLDKLNEPLDWRSDDEIGLLIGEYNRMLVKLEEKKQALSQSEKQAAWREMAKQVAHEIKNPLTPMKLTLQHLQRTLANNDNPNAKRILQRPLEYPNAKRILQRTLDSLLDQIDNLSDIAASFSDFAKMPLPKNDLFEITSVFNKAADLYADDKNIELIREVPTHPITVMGDRQLIGRILTNLIINGVQSVPSTRKPVVKLKLSVSDENISIEIQDNGVGIPEAIRNKIFLPNFSTKQGGSGLGLAIAKRGVEHAGGSIWFETETNEGTTFFITLPLVHSSTEIVPLMDGQKL